jgi:hypothetical protein
MRRIRWSNANIVVVKLNSTKPIILTEIKFEDGGSMRQEVDIPVRLPIWERCGVKISLPDTWLSQAMTNMHWYRQIAEGLEDFNKTFWSNSEVGIWDCVESNIEAERIVLSFMERNKCFVLVDKIIRLDKANNKEDEIDLYEYDDYLR